MVLTTTITLASGRGALTSLDVSDNNLGKLLPQEGWTKGAWIRHNGGEIYHWSHTDGRKEEGVMPSGSKPDGIVALANAIPDMGALTSLNLASNNLGALLLPAGWTHHPDNSASYRFMHTDSSHQEAAPEGTSYPGAITIADAIKDMRAISSVNLLKNSIPVKQAQELVKIMQSKEKLTTLCGLSKEETKLDFSNQGLDAGDAVLIANDISDMRALSTLVLKDNRLATKAAGEALAKALAGNSALKELDVSSNNWKNAYGEGDGPGFAMELAVGIRDNGALTKFDISKCELMAEGGKVLAAGLKGNQVITELNISDNELGMKSDGISAEMSGIIAIADAIPDMGAMTRLNLSNNRMDTKEAGEALGGMLQVNSTLKELDISANHSMGGGNAAFAKGMAAGLVDNGAMTSLNVSNNSLGLAAGWGFSSDQWWLNSEYPPGHSEGNPCSQLPAAGSDLSGIVLLADAIKKNGAMTSLNLASSYLHSGGAKIIAGAIKVPVP
jgi:Leucine-rich repeat (LRR) protein